MRIAYEMGQPVPPELIAALTREDSSTGPTYTLLPTPDRDFRRGLVLVFIGLGFAAACAYALYLGIGVYSAITGRLDHRRVCRRDRRYSRWLPSAWPISSSWLAKRNSAQP